MSMTEEQRKVRHERWEALGLDRVKHDLLNGGFRLVGGSPEVREEAWAWVRSKEAAAKGEAAQAAATKEVVTLKPGVWGFSIDLKQAWRALQEWWQRRG